MFDCPIPIRKVLAYRRARAVDDLATTVTRMLACGPRTGDAEHVAELDREARELRDLLGLLGRGAS